MKFAELGAKQIVLVDINKNALEQVRDRSTSQ